MQAVLGYVLGINESSLLFSAGHALGGVGEGSSVDDDYDGKRAFLAGIINSRSPA